MNFNKNQNTNSSYNVSAIYGKHEVEQLHDVNHQLTSESFKNEKHNYNNNINGITNDNDNNNNTILSFMKDNNDKDNLNLFNYSFNNNYPSNISSTALGSVEDRKNSITLNYNTTTYNNNSNSNNKGNTNTVSNTKNKVRKKTPGSIPCEHCGCKLLFTTLKQKLNHHNKMNKNCRKDTIHLLKALTEIKKIILSLNLKHTCNSTPFIPETLINKYNSILSNIPHKEYALLFPGVSFMEDISVETELVEDDDDDDDNELC